MSQLESVSQTLEPGARIELFKFDGSFAGGEELFFCQSANISTPVAFGGVTYSPRDVSFEGFEVAGTGVMPAPRMKVANTDGVFQSLINTFGDMLGCTVQRVRTFQRFLDNGATPDPTAYYGPDTFKVERKVEEGGEFIEWELSADFDQAGKLLPARQVIRDTCLWRYRIYRSATDTFDYAKAQCPYTGSDYFDHLDQPTTKANDRPSRRLTCCKLRFGENAPLPFGGFPGVARVRP